MAQAQKQCIFCSNPANSKEHFWPVWMHAILPRLPNPKHDRKIINFSPKQGRLEGGVNARQGGLETIRIRAVCENCNSGWMNILEEKVRPLITPIITGTPIALDFEQLAVIARWVTLKCIVAEYASPGVWVTPSADRIVFRDRGTIPDFFRIYLANHNMKNATGFVRHSLCILTEARTADPPLVGAPKNTQTVTFVIGRAFVHLNAARVRDYTIESRHSIEPFYGHSRIWPLQHDKMVWPRRPLIDQAGMSLIANTLDTIQGAAVVHWIDETD